MKTRVEKLCQAFENGKELVELSQCSPHDISNVLKLYLRQVHISSSTRDTLPQSKKPMIAVHEDLIELFYLLLVQDFFRVCVCVYRQTYIHTYKYFAAKCINQSS